MAKFNELICSHNQHVLVDRFMIIHQFGSSLCDSDTFRNAKNVYDRKGVRTGTPLDFGFLKKLEANTI